MQNFDEIKKMAEMARSLRERGLAKDSLDAMQQARSVTSSDPTVMQQRKETQQEERLAVLERKHEYHLRKLDDLQAQLDQSNKKILELTAQLTTLSVRIHDVEVASTMNIPAPQWQPPQWTQPASEAKPIDRNGVAPSEVSVEKFFYFGNKR
jgi:hypothetical protein